MIRVFDFQCDDGHVHEMFVRNTDDQLCPVCGKAARHKPAAPRCVLDGTTGDFPGAAMKWERKREEKLKQERKTEANHGPISLPR